MPPEPGIKTYAEHLDYLAEIVRLKLWFVGHWLAHHPREDLVYVLRQRVDLYRKTVFWQGQGFPTQADFALPGWLAVERQVHAAYRRAGRGANHSTFERRAFDAVWPVVEAETIGPASRARGSAATASTTTRPRQSTPTESTCTSSMPGSHAPSLTTGPTCWAVSPA